MVILRQESYTGKLTNQTFVYEASAGGNGAIAASIFSQTLPALYLGPVQRVSDVRTLTKWKDILEYRVELSSLGLNRATHRAGLKYFEQAVDRGVLVPLYTSWASETYWFMMANPLFRTRTSPGHANPARFQYLRDTSDEAQKDYMRRCRTIRKRWLRAGTVPPVPERLRIPTIPRLTRAATREIFQTWPPGEDPNNDTPNQRASRTLRSSTEPRGPATTRTRRPGQRHVRFPRRR